MDWSMFNHSMFDRVLDLFRAEGARLREAALIQLPNLPVEEERRAVERELNSAFGRFDECLKTVVELLRV